MNCTLDGRDHWMCLLALKAENQKDIFSKGIMDKCYVLQASNPL